MESESLREKYGKLEKYLDWITQLVWQMGYTGDVITDNIKQGLTCHLRGLCGMVMDIPVDRPVYMERLWKLGHVTNQTNAYEQEQSRSASQTEPH